MMDRQHNGQKKKAKKRNNDLQKKPNKPQKHTHKTKDRVTSRMNSCSPEGQVVHVPLVAPVVLI